LTDEKTAVATDRKHNKIKQRMAVVSGLSAKERTAVIEYLLHGNKTNAYRVGYGDKKYADRAASRLFKKPKIIAAIEEYFHEDEMSAREAVAILSQQARGSMRDFVSIPRNEEGEPDRTAVPDIDLWKAEELGQLHLIKKIKSKKTTRRLSRSGSTEDAPAVYIDEATVEIELHDSQAAVDKIMRYWGLYKDNLTVDLDLSNLSDEELNALDDTL